MYGSGLRGATQRVNACMTPLIPVQVIYEDDICLAFRDINPCAPVHFLVIPKVKGGLSRLSRATEADKSTLGHLMYVAQQVAKQGGSTSYADTLMSLS